MLRLLIYIDIIILSEHEMIVNIKQNDELVFINLMTCGSGHPVFEMSSMCSVYHMPPKFGSREASPLLRNFTEEESSEIWNIYLRSYLDTKRTALDYVDEGLEPLVFE